jgi:hypothetical protein
MKSAAVNCRKRALLERANSETGLPRTRGMGRVAGYTAADYLIQQASSAAGSPPPSGYLIPSA